MCNVYFGDTPHPIFWLLVQAQCNMCEINCSYFEDVVARFERFAKRDWTAEERCETAKEGAT